MRPPEFHNEMQVGDITVTIRTMHPEDREIEQAFIRRLSPESRYFRFHSAIKELTPGMLDRFTHVDYPDEMALLATIPDGNAEREIGVARYVRNPGTDEAEMAIVVDDDWHRKGIATRLLLDLRQCAIEAGITMLHASVMSDNTRMFALAQKLGFNPEPHKDDFSAAWLGKNFKDLDDPD